jgi:hypothetical protein
MAADAYEGGTLMLKRSLIALLLMLGVTTITIAQTTPPFLDKDAARIREKIEDLGVGHRLTIKMKNGDYYHGTVSKVDAASFEMAEVDLAQVVKFQYAEIKSLYGSYGEKNLFGKRPNPKKSSFIALGALVGCLLVPILIVATARD